MPPLSNERRMQRLDRAAKAPEKIIHNKAMEVPNVLTTEPTEVSENTEKKLNYKNILYIISV